MYQPCRPPSRRQWDAASEQMRRPSPSALPDPSSTPKLRATDAARELAADTLRQALAEGSLTIDETEQRLEAIYAARDHNELDLVLSDLPQQQRATRARAASRRAHLAPPMSLWPVLIAALAAAALVGALFGAHIIWPLWPVAFIAARRFWWRRRPGRWRAFTGG